MTKPHIRKLRVLWSCSSPGLPGIRGYGRSPVEAYRQWAHFADKSLHRYVRFGFHNTALRSVA